MQGLGVLGFRVYIRSLGFRVCKWLWGLGLTLQPQYCVGYWGMGTIRFIDGLGQIQVGKTDILATLCFRAP